MFTLFLLLSVILTYFTGVSSQVPQARLGTVNMILRNSVIIRVVQHKGENDKIDSPFFVACILFIYLFFL